MEIKEVNEFILSEMEKMKKLNNIDWVMWGRTILGFLGGFVLGYYVLGPIVEYLFL